MFLITSPVFAQPKLVINEIVSSNASTVQDEEGDYSDWVELYNAGATGISLHNYGLSDDPDELSKWVFPEITLEANAYVVIWLSGKDRSSSFHPLHANFKLKSDGEHLLLTTEDGSTVDFIEPVSIPTDFSYGRNPDGSSNWSFFETPTPGTNNNTESYNEVLAAVDLSRPSGFYTSSFNLTLAHNDPNVTIVYTLDGSVPDLEMVESDSEFKKSYIYESPINLRSRIGEANLFSQIRTTQIPRPWLPEWQPPVSEVYKTNIIRTRAFKANAIPSETNTATFFIDEDVLSLYPTLPILSIAADYNDFFDPSSGIYVPGNNIESIHDQNFMKGWTRNANLEFFDIERTNGFSGIFEIKIQGLSSRTSPQKALHVISRSHLSSALINYPLFNTVKSGVSEISEFKRFIIRSWGSAIGNALRPMFVDAYHQKLAEENEIDVQAYRPCVVFINGEYWGIHELREANKNSWYYQTHYGIDRDNPGYDILAGGNPAEADEGHLDHWNSLIEFVNSNEMDNPENFEIIEGKVDTQNLIEYIIHCVFLGKRDWPVQNEVKWRPRTPEGKWRWAQFDMDHGLSNWGGDYNMIKGVMVDNPHELFVKLMDNLHFKNQFLNTYADWMNTTLSKQRELSIFEEMRTEIEPYIPEYVSRWPLGMNWNANIQDAEARINRRLDFKRQNLTDFFNLDTLAITVSSDPDKGYIKINSIEINENTPGIIGNPYTWSGVYFQNIPVTISAIAKLGYKFSHWSGFTSSTSKEITILPDKNHSLQAHYLEENVLVSLFPNPTTKELTLRVDESVVGAFYEIYDLQGQLKLNGTLNQVNTRIDLRRLSTGLYSLRVGDNNSLNFKILKN